MNKSYYFSHDYNSANDVKILFLRQQLGMEGYGIYWFLVENLAQAGGILPLNITPVLAMQMQTNKAKQRPPSVSWAQGENLRPRRPPQNALKSRANCSARLHLISPAARCRRHRQRRRHLRRSRPTPTASRGQCVTSCTSFACPPFSSGAAS